jgi:hypothetical protein
MQIQAAPLGMRPAESFVDSGIFPNTKNPSFVAKRVIPSIIYKSESSFFWYS